MRREDFLKQFWSPYPAAPNGCKSLARWTQNVTSEVIWLGGILSWNSVASAEGGELQIISADQSLPLQWDLPYLFAKSPEDAGEPLAQLSVSHILQPGDQVAVQVKNGRITKLMLLAPTLKERPVIENTATLKKWSKFVSEVREYLTWLGYQELNTPSLVACPGMEPTLEPFQVGDKFLPTSPEIHLKKALSLGFTDLFEIKSCFRNKENSPNHQPEFQMLEWYRSYANLTAIRDDIAGMIKVLSKNDPASFKIHELTFAEMFQKYLGFTLTPQTTRADLCGLAADLKIAVDEKDSWNDVFNRIFVEKLEPTMAKCPPTILKDFPPSQAALSRLTEAGWADRFEFYWEGLEIANAFHEVNDPAEQERRWQVEADERKHLGTANIPTDPELIEHMKMGMPPAGGIALGLERLFMALYGVKDIAETRLFPS
jgi:lysyl-tRNA synthetase class 2